ncbi:hypothetical protein AYI68_g1046 [Smittium mucronatum]|uniref:Uncharacterized protein n=1 Tax=Smittium mucronatum TaxID=133383 RepID=A0A1R0H6R5_9FUNG|nr:hypothetical protein AYI68_g1046 [Smittium mucronatum]
MNAPERFEMFVLPDGVKKIRSMAGETAGAAGFGEFGLPNNMMPADNEGGMYGNADPNSGIHEDHDTDF